LSGLDYLHQKKITHLDLNPNNVLVMNDFSKIKLVDFGLSAILSKSSSLIDVTHGTFQFMPPEHIMDKKSSFKSDLYSYGCVLFNLFTHKLPWKLNPFQMIYKFSIKETPSVMNEDIPEYAKEIIEPCLKFNMKERLSAKILLEIVTKYYYSN